MTIFKYLRVIFLSLYWQLPYAKEVNLIGGTEIARSQIRKKNKRKRLKKKEKLPVIQRRIKRHQRFKNTKPKDARYSDQRKLRRMFRGV